MDFLNKLLAQLSDLFKSMSPGARITAGLLLAAVVISLGYLFTSGSAGGDAFLLNGQSFTADELSGMEAAFGKAGLSDYSVEGARVRISKSRQAAYLAALADGGALPAHFGDYLTTAAGGSGPFTSRAQQEEMMKVAKQRELAMVIRSMNGIENAVVHYDMQKRPGGLQQNQTVTASVSVKPRGNMQLEEHQVPKIRSLVAAAIAGLAPENVTVVDINGRAYTAKAGGIGSPLDDPYLSMTRAHKDLIEQGIRDALSYVPGVTVTANVVIDREMEASISSQTADPKTIPFNQEVTEKTSTSTSGGGPRGVPGLNSNGPNTPATLPVAAAAGSQIEETNSVSKTISGTTSSSSETKKMAGLTPQSVSVAIGVPSDYFLKVWQVQNPPAAGEQPKTPDAAALTAVETAEVKKIKDHVVALIPKPTGTAAPVDPNTLVTVTPFSHVAPEEVAGPSIVDRGLDWLAQSWSTLGMIGLGLFSLLMLRSFVRSTPAPAETSPNLLSATVGDDETETATAGATGAVAAATATGDSKEPGKGKQRTLQRKLGSGPNLREELIEMVREDPDAAANILRGWIGNVT